MASVEEIRARWRSRMQYLARVGDDVLPDVADVRDLLAALEAEFERGRASARRHDWRESGELSQRCAQCESHRDHRRDGWHYELAEGTAEEWCVTLK